MWDAAQKQHWRNVGSVDAYSEVQAQLDDSADDVDPKSAEYLIRAAARGETELGARVPPDEVAGLEILLTYRLMSTLDLTDEDLEAFLTEAARVASQWNDN